MIKNLLKNASFHNMSQFGVAKIKDYVSNVITSSVTVFYALKFFLEYDAGFAYVCFYYFGPTFDVAFVVKIFTYVSGWI